MGVEETFRTEMMLAYICVIDTLLLVLVLAIVLSWSWLSLTHSRGGGPVMVNDREYDYHDHCRVAPQKQALRADAELRQERQSILRNPEHNLPSRAGDASSVLGRTVGRTFLRDDAFNQSAPTLTASHSAPTLTFSHSAPSLTSLSTADARVDKCLNESALRGRARRALRAHSSHSKR